MDHISVGTPTRQRKDGFGLILEIDDATETMFGWSRDESIGRRTLDFIHPDDQQVAIDGWLEMLREPGAECTYRLRWRCADETYRWVESRNVNALDDDGFVHSANVLIDSPQGDRPSYTIVHGESGEITGSGDVDGPTAATTSPNKMIEHLLREHDRVVRRLTDALPYGIAHVASSGQVLQSNASLCQLFGAGVATTIDELLDRLPGDDADRVRQALARALAGDGPSSLEVTTIWGDEDRQLRLDIRSFNDDRGTEALLCVEDVTDRLRLRAELERRATYDDLTGCLNRRSILAILDERDAGDGDCVGLVFIDLDGFKSVNDRFGHATGDSLLREVGFRLQLVAGERADVGRIGGDEFLVVRSGQVDGPGMLDLARRIAEAFAQPMMVGDEMLPILASIGVAVERGEQRDADELIATADAAMYRAKRNGQGAGIELAFLGEWPAPEETAVAGLPAPSPSAMVVADTSLPAPFPGG